MPNDHGYPFVSVLMPIRNEADFIERALNSVLNNDYPADRMEVLVSDGMSTDGTQTVVNRIAEKDSRVRLIENHGKIVSSGLNCALKQIKGDVFIRIDGHCEIPSDFIKKSVNTLLDKKEAWVVGGMIDTVADSFVGKAISAAMQSPVGVGNAMFRRGDYEGWVDTLAFGMHQRAIIDKIGYFDEQLVRNQDDDFNFRILQAGGKIWMSRNIKSIYYARSSLKKLWRQYFQYGFWRIRTIQKHGQPATLRQLAPVLLVSSMVVLGVLSGFHSIFLWLLIAALCVYGLGLIYGAVNVGRKQSFKYAAISPMIFIILHFGYGLGSLWGIVRFILLKGRGLPKPEEHRLSR